MNNAHPNPTPNPMDPTQKKAMISFFVMLTVAIIGITSYYFLPPTVEATPAPAVKPAPVKQPAPVSKTEAKPTDTDGDEDADVSDEDADEDVSDADADTDEGASVLHDEQFPKLPQVEEFQMQGIDLNKLVAEEARVQAETKALKTAKANLKKIRKCLKSTKTKITKNLFRKGKMYGDWTPSRELRNGRCRTLTYTRDLEADAFTFAAAVSTLLKREINSFKLSLEYDDDNGTVTITLLTKEERAKLKWELAKAKRLAKAKAKQLKLARKLAKAELARRKLAKAKYVPKGTAAKLISEGKILWKDGLKAEARKKWKSARAANPTKNQRRKIKLYLSLK